LLCSILSLAFINQIIFKKYLNFYQNRAIRVEFSCSWEKSQHDASKGLDKETTDQGTLKLISQRYSLELREHALEWLPFTLRLIGEITSEYNTPITFLSMNNHLIILFLLSSPQIFQKYLEQTKDS